MKKIICFLLMIILTLGLFAGCEGTYSPATTPTESVTNPEPTEPEPTEPEPTEPEPTLPILDEDALAASLPEGATLFGLDLSGMNYEEATEALTELIAAYKLKMTVNGTSFTLTASKLSMDLSIEQFAYWFTETVTEKTPDDSNLILCDLSELLSSVTNMFGDTAKNAAVTYKKSVSRFVVEPHKDGNVVDTQQVEDQALSAIRSLTPEASASASVSDSEAAVKDTDPKVTAAMNEANSYLTISLQYTFQAEGIASATEKVDVDSLASMLKIQKDYTVAIDESAVQSYVHTMAVRHGGTKVAPFITTGGATIGYNVEYFKAVLNRAAMCQDLISCLKNKVSGTRSTNYLTGSNANKPYGGDYVEVNLNDQCLWVYKNGVMMISTDLVSGNVSTNHWTDPGVFTLYDKTRNATLMGTGYISHVDYWMAFNGPVGLHDATWRSSFGGEIYKYNGSHGCVNLPYNAAKQIYDIVYEGMKVIVYGGAKSVSTRPQEITGTSAYNVTTETEPFSLDIKLKYSDAEITYTSSDTGVVTVSSQGIVTVVGAGTATITVKSEIIGAITGSEFTVTITVAPGQLIDPEPTDPEPTDPEPTDPEPTDPESSGSEPVDPESTDSESSGPEPVDPEPTDSETSDTTGTE